MQFRTVLQQPQQSRYHTGPRPSGKATLVRKAGFRAEQVDYSTYFFISCRKVDAGDGERVVVVVKNGCRSGPQHAEGGSCSSQPDTRLGLSQGFCPREKGASLLPPAGLKAPAFSL